VTSEVNGLPITRFDLSYDYYDNGQVKTRGELASGVSESYTYDARGRLRNWDRAYKGVTRTRTYDFDSAGNLDDVWLTGGGVPPEFEDLIYPQAQSARPHAAQAKGAYTYFYDDDGRLEMRKKQGATDRTFSYNSRDLPSSGWSNGVTFSVAYDAHGERFRKDSTIETTYVAGIYERRRDGSSASHRHLVPLEGGAMAIVTLTASQKVTTHYAVTDDTGTPHVILRDDGAVDERLFYAPYGGRLDVDGNEVATAPAALSYGMTGHEYDDEIGLVNMGGRVYDPELRRFLTPDPLISGPFSARGIDRYGYVDGDPANKFDPTGFSSQEYTPSNDPPANDTCSDGGCGVDLTGTGVEAAAGVATPVNQDPTTGVSAGGDGADPNVGQGGYYIDEGFGEMLQTLETAGDVALGISAGALAVAAFAASAQAAAVWAAENMGTAGVATGGTGSVMRQYGARAMMMGKAFVRAGARKAVDTAFAVGSRLSGWAQRAGSWASSVGSRVSRRVQGVRAFASSVTSRVSGWAQSLGNAARRAAPKLCFAAETVVETERGLIPIEEVEVGVRVWARDDETGEEEWKPITEVFITPNRELLELTFEADNGYAQFLRLTAEHPLWSLDDGEWDEAGHLSLGERVDTLTGPMYLVSATSSPKAETVYNLEVSDSHTYFVGAAGLWAHNRCRRLWKVSEEGTEQVMRHYRFGKFYKSVPDRAGESLWWSKDRAGHGEVAWKVFKEGARGLRHFRDADKYGDFILKKHKGPVGRFVLWNELNASGF